MRASSASVSTRPGNRVVAPDLLPVDRPSAASRSRWQVAIPASLVIAAILAALVLPVWQKREEAIALHQQSDQARQRAGVSDALRTELERRVGEYNFALERKIRLSGNGTGARRHHAPAARRHVAHAARAAQRPRERRPARVDAARRIGERWKAGFAARGFEAVHAGRAALADNEDPARSRRDLRRRRAVEAAAAAGDAARPHRAATAAGCAARARLPRLGVPATAGAVATPRPRVPPRSDGARRCTGGNRASHDGAGESCGGFTQLRRAARSAIPPGQPTNPGAPPMQTAPPPAAAEPEPRRR